MVTGRNEDNSKEAEKYNEIPFVKDLKATMKVDLVDLNTPIQYYPPYWKKDGNIDRLYADEAFT